MAGGTPTLGNLWKQIIWLQSSTLEVKVPASNTYDVEPRILTARPFYADFEMSTASWRHRRYLQRSPQCHGDLIADQSENSDVFQHFQTFSFQTCFFFMVFSWHSDILADFPMVFPMGNFPIWWSAKVKGGFLWIIIVHKNHTAEVNELAVKTGLLPTGTVNCKLLDVEAVALVGGAVGHGCAKATK